MIWVLLILVFLGGICGGAFALSDEGIRLAARDGLQRAWEWIEGNVLSNLLSTSALVGLVSLELIPAIKGFVNAKAAFATVARQVSEYTEARVEFDMRAEERERAFEARMEERERRADALEAELLRSMDEFLTLAKAFEGQVAESEARISEALVRIDRNADKTERMVGLAFTNSGELVSKGVARRIAEVEQEE